MRCFNKCILCGHTYSLDAGSPGNVLCLDCLKRVDDLFISDTADFCHVCGNPVLRASICHRCTMDGDFIRNGETVQGDKSKRVLKTYSAFYYSGLISELIRYYKFEAVREIAILFGFYLHKLIYRLGYTDVPIVPVPGNRKNIYKRGWDQSEFLATWIRHYHARSIYPVIRRSHTKRELKKMGRGDRRATAHSLFRLNKSFAISELRNNKNTLCNEYLEHDSYVILLDDIITTGSTMQAAADLLISSGIQVICGISAAMD